MLRIAVHAGFHKTGTTTMQHTLRAARDVLDGHAKIYLRPEMADLCDAARAWSATRSAADLARVTHAASGFADALPESGTVILSSEDLAGHMPGRKGLKTYDAVPTLMSVLEAALFSARPSADIAFLFTTRAAAPWLRSCYAQHVRVMRHTGTAEDYETDYQASADLAGVVASVAAAVPRAEVKSEALEDHRGRLGPLQPLLDLAGIPSAISGLVRPIPPANTSAKAEQIELMLELNRSELRGVELRAAKRAILGLPPRV